jgi:hypothetical protein
MHYHRFRRTGDPGNDSRKIRKKGEGTTSKGYIREYLPEHPCADSAGYILQHRLVLEKIVGRHLLPTENVHHKNGVKGDNRPENLELWSSFQPAGQRIEDKVFWAKEILRLYDPDYHRT